jgi:hypothetical protein
VDTLQNGNRVVTVGHGPINADRLPVYHRLDLRVTRRWELEHGRISAFLDVFNAYDRENTSGLVDHLTLSNGVLNRTQTVRPFLPILPTFGVSWEF